MHRVEREAFEIIHEALSLIRSETVKNNQESFLDALADARGRVSMLIRSCDPDFAEMFDMEVV